MRWPRREVTRSSAGDASFALLQCLEPIRGQFGFGARWILPDDALIRSPSGRGLPLLRLRDAVLEERRWGVLGSWILADHHAVHRIRLGGPFLFGKRLPDVQLGGRRLLEVRIQSEQLLESGARGAMA